MYICINDTSHLPHATAHPRGLVAELVRVALVDGLRGEEEGAGSGARLVCDLRRDRMGPQLLSF